MPADYRAALTAAIADPGIHAVMVIHAPPLQHAIGEPTEAIDEACRDSPKPVVAIMLGAGNGPLCPGSPIPSFRFPEQPAAVLGRIADYSEWRRADARERADLEAVRDDIDLAAASAIIAERVDAGEVPPESVAALLACYGVTMADGRRVDAAGAVDAAEAIGYPVAIKAEHRRVGRTVAAGVALDLVDAAEVVAAIAAMQEHLGDDVARVIVQRMVPPGLDVRVRVRDDERVGPVISVGLGGVQADTIGDEVSRLAPVSPSTGATMIREARAGGALDEHEIERLADVVARVAQLASDHHEIAELDLNPVVVAGNCWVVDARLSLRHPERPGPLPRRLEEG
jgi:acyl-CoA synthetase (NDP forming)